MPNRIAISPAKLQLPLEIIGADILGQQFFERSETRTIHRNGVSFFLANEVAPGTEVIVRNPETDVEAIAFVLGQTAQGGEGKPCNLTFLETSPELWQVAFPAAGEARTVSLECATCHSVAEHSLADIELEMFAAARVVARPCQRCNSTAFWREARLVDRQKTPTELPAPVRTAIRSRSKEWRRNRRTSVKTEACIRFSGVDLMVACEDMSKGGFRFTSQKQYPEGIRIEAAVPYIKSSTNIFCPAAIIYSQRLPNGWFRQGASYIKRPSPLGWDP